MASSIADRIWAKVDRSGSCWIWTGALLRNGYGYAWDGQRARMAHRIAFELTNGPIPDGLVIDHLCRAKACVNPDHLEAVTQAENVRRGEAAKIQSERRRGQTHCLRGHELAGENLRLDKRGRRSCRTCHRVADRERKRVQRAGVAA